MDCRNVVHPSLSIGYYSPGWPVTAFANGIVTYTATLVPALEAMGLQVTIFAGRVAEETLNGSVYNVQQAMASRSISSPLSTGFGIASRPRRQTDKCPGGGSSEQFGALLPSGGFRSSRWKSRLARHGG